MSAKKEEYQMKTTTKLFYLGFLILFVFSLYSTYQEYLNDKLDIFSGKIIAVFIVFAFLLIIILLIVALQIVFPKSRLLKKLEDWFEKFLDLIHF